MRTAITITVTATVTHATIAAALPDTAATTLLSPSSYELGPGTPQ